MRQFFERRWFYCRFVCACGNKGPWVWGSVPEQAWPKTQRAGWRQWDVVGLDDGRHCRRDWKCPLHEDKHEAPTAR